MNVSATAFVCGGLLVVFASCDRSRLDTSNEPRAGAMTIGLSDDELVSLLGKESAKCAKLSCQMLDIAEPVQVKDAAGYWDGGSRSLTLVDAKGTEYEFMILREAQGPMEIHRTRVRSERRQVEVTGLMERDLYAVLLRWILAHPRRDALLGKDKLDPVKEKMLDETSQFYFRMRGRVAPAVAICN